MCWLTYAWFQFQLLFQEVWKQYKDRTLESLDHLFKEALILCHDQSFQNFNLLDEGIQMALKHL